MYDLHRPSAAPNLRAYVLDTSRLAYLVDVRVAAQAEPDGTRSKDNFGRRELSRLLGVKAFDHYEPWKSLMFKKIRIKKDPPDKYSFRNLLVIWKKLGCSIQIEETPIRKYKIRLKNNEDILDYSTFIGKNILSEKFPKDDLLYKRKILELSEYWVGSIWHSLNLWNRHKEIQPKITSFILRWR